MGIMVYSSLTDGNAAFVSSTVLLYLLKKVPNPGSMLGSPTFSSSRLVLDEGTTDLGVDGKEATGVPGS